MQEYLKDKNTSPIALLNKRYNISDVATLELFEATKVPIDRESGEGPTTFLQEAILLG